MQFEELRRSMEEADEEQKHRVLRSHAGVWGAIAGGRPGARGKFSEPGGGFN